MRLIKGPVIIACYIFLICSGCGSEKKAPDFIEISLSDNFNDTCVITKNDKGDTASFYRNITIVENSFQDTLNIGFSIVTPGQTGDIFISQSGTSKSSAINTDPAHKEYIMGSDSPEAKTNALCIYHYNGTTINKGQQIKFRLPIRRIKS